MDAIKAITSDFIKVPLAAAGSDTSTESRKVDKQAETAGKSVTAGKSSAAESDPGKEKIKRIADAMDSYVQSIQRDLNIQVHEETGKIMVKVVSRDTGEVIREIPPKELLDLAAKMDEMTGTLFNEKV